MIEAILAGLIVVHTVGLGDVPNKVSQLENHNWSRIRYSIEATFDPQNRTIYGNLDASIGNTFGEGEEIILLLYPNIYLKEGPAGSYPRRFNPGWLKILSITDKEGNPLELLPLNGEIVFKIISDHPLSIIRIEFLTRFPERLGPFGYYDEITTLQGGWHPILTNKPEGEILSSDYEVRIIIPHNCTPLHSGITMKEEQGNIEFKAEDIKSPTIVLSKKHIRSYSFTAGVPIELYFLKKDEIYIKKALKILESAGEYFRKNFPDPKIETIHLGEVHLYGEMVMAGEGIILLNNRLFKVFPYLRRFHEIELVNALYTLYWERMLKDEDWVPEGMADYSTSLYIQDRYHRRPDLVEDIKTFSFIPAIDEILYCPRFPFRQTYFYTEEFRGLREDFRLFNSKRLKGGTVFRKLASLVGENVFIEIIKRYIQSYSLGRKSFRTISEEVSGRELDWFYDQWIKKGATADYYLKEVKRDKEDALYLTEITVGKMGDAIEPVELLTKDARGRKEITIWDGDGEETVIKRYTLSPLKVIEIDPEKRLSDTNRLNNRIPKRWKLILNRFRLSYDLSARTLEGDIILSFERLYDPTKKVIFNYYNRQELDGIRIGYVIPSLSFSLGVERLSERFYRIGNNRYIVSPVLSYSHRGIEIELDSSSKILGSDYSYLRIQLKAIEEFQIANKESIAIRAILGQSSGEMPEHKMFFLGGINGARGFSKSEDRGKNISLFTAEYRFPLFYDLDKNLLNLITVHTFQVAFFSDTGMVSDKRNTFRVREYKYDIGMGFRFHVNLLGIYPGIGRVDIAMPVGPDVRHQPNYYLSIGQSF